MSPGAGGRPGRRARRAVVLILLLPVAAGLVRAQGPCDTREVRDYLAGLRWPRPARAAGPPAGWSLCVSGSPRGSREVMEAHVRLRSAPAIPGTGRDEAWLLKGSQPPNTVTREVLNGWRALLHGPATPERFQDPHYQALLGALALMVLDAGKGLEVLRIPYVLRLKGALEGSVRWETIEAALDEFRYVPLWSGQGGAGPSLTALQSRVAGLDPAVYATDCARTIVAEIARGGRPDVYWKRIEPRIADLRRCEPPVRPPPPSVARVPLPPGCVSRACRALERWNGSGETARWTEAREAFRDAISDAERRLAALARGLPGGVDWSPARAAVEAAREAAAGLDRPPDGIGAARFGGVVAGLEDLAGRLSGLESIAAYRRALLNLAAGNPGLARNDIEATGPDWKRRPELVAAYLAAAYWESGGDGVERVCREGNLDCGRDSVGEEARRVERLLGLPDGALGPGQIS